MKNHVKYYENCQLHIPQEPQQRVEEVPVDKLRGSNEPLEDLIRDRVNQFLEEHVAAPARAARDQGVQVPPVPTAPAEGVRRRIPRAVHVLPGRNVHLRVSCRDLTKSRRSRDRTIFNTLQGAVADGMHLCVTVDLKGRRRSSRTRRMAYELEENELRSVE